MDLFPQDLEVELYKTGFEYDLLNRKVISRQLSELVEKIDNPIVIALDDKWGSGKTYFLKRWVGAHKAENGGSATTVYFDAFANDYLSEPLVSIISAVSERITADGSETLQKWKNVAAKLIKPTFGLALSLVTLGAKQHLEDFGDAVADAVSSEAKDTAEGLWAAEKEKKDALREFTSLLRELTTQSGAPIVIVVDELDRCRPDYALSVLEIIKHFFSVPQVHFVLGINGTALESSVRARYGVDIDAESYLRKFINVSFSLPQFVVGQENSGVLKKYASEMSSEMGLHEQVSRKCTELVGHVSHSNKISLRDVGKILSRIALLPKNFPSEIREGYIQIICMLIVSIVVNPIFHKKLVSGYLTFEEIMHFFGVAEINIKERIGDDYNEEYDHEITTWVVVMMICSNPEKLKSTNYLNDWSAEFRHLRSEQNSTSVPLKLHKDYIELFRL